MTDTLKEGYAKDEYDRKAKNAAADSKAAHHLSVVTAKDPSMHITAVEAHQKASSSHFAARDAATHEDQMVHHGEHVAHHEEFAHIHGEQHRAHTGDANYQTDVHKSRATSLVKYAKRAIGESTMSESIHEDAPAISAMVQKIATGDHVSAAADFDGLVNTRLDTLLTARTKELAAQVFGPGVIESVEIEEPDEDDEIAQHLQTLADNAYEELTNEAGDAEIDEDVFIESFNAALESNDLTEYSLWRPTQAGFTKKGMARKASGNVGPMIGKKVSKEKQKHMDAFKAKLASGKTTTYGYNERPKVEEVEPEDGQENLTELKARTLRHYVGHATKQIKSATGEIKRAKAQGNTAVEKHFQDRVAKRKAGIKTVLGKQKDAAKKRAASATAKAAEASKQEKALDKPAAKEKAA